jgi:hypothetical protein
MIHRREHRIRLVFGCLIPGILLAVSVTSAEPAFRRFVLAVRGEKGISLCSRPWAAVGA